MRSLRAVFCWLSGLTQLRWFSSILCTPLHVIAQVNAAEAEFWRRSQGNRVDFSDRILGFECGGQQWVNEVSFPVGTLEKPDGKDLDYMVRQVLQGAGSRYAYV